jgi:hypothetical protein
MVRAIVILMIMGAFAGGYFLGNQQRGAGVSDWAAETWKQFAEWTGLGKSGEQVKAKTREEPKETRFRVCIGGKTYVIGEGAQPQGRGQASK